MAFVIAQISDTHVGGPAVGSGDRLTLAVEAINEMTKQPDLVLISGDLTQSGTADEWSEFQQRAGRLTARWIAMRGNHDQPIADLAGHRALDLGPLRMVLIDSSSEHFTSDDASWLDDELTSHPDHPTVIAIHHPPFETGIWWMDCIGLNGAELFEAIVRRHRHVRLVLSGHVHRPIVTTWEQCVLWACPSTAVSIAPDLDPAHAPAETDEGPMISLHAFVGDSFVSHLVPVGRAAARTSINETAPAFVEWARNKQLTQPTRFHD